MRHLFIYSLLACLSTSTLIAQSLISNTFTTLYITTCDNDPSKVVKKAVGWEVYQTLDDTFDGPRDTTVCPTFKSPGQLDLFQNIYASRPIFIRAQLTADSTPLRPNYAYEINAVLNGQATAKLAAQTSTCTEQVCSAVRAEILIPDADGTPKAAKRIHFAQIRGGLNGNNWSGSTSACLPTEYFSTQFLGSYVIKLTIDPNATITPTSTVTLQNAYFRESFTNPPNLVSQIVAKPQNLIAPNQYQMRIYDLGSTPGNLGNPYVIRYPQAVGYPSASSLGYVEAAPQPNTAQPVTITLVIGTTENLFFQPFAQLRGGLTTAPDSTRHQFILNNQGGDMCFNFIDLIIHGGDTYRHSGGNLDFHSPYSCIQVQTDADIIVADGKRFIYGPQNTGMLALHPGAEITLEPYASMEVRNVVSLFSNAKNQHLKQPRIYLKRGSHLVFTESAQITNQFSDNQSARLQIVMEGGTISYGALSAESAALLEFVAPDLYTAATEGVTAYPNPVQDVLQVHVAQHRASVQNTSVLSVDGRVLHHFNNSARQDRFEVPMQHLQLGVYYLHNTHTDGSRSVLRVVRVE